MWMEECYHFNIVHFVFSFYSLLYSYLKNQIYLCFIRIFKLLFEKFFISVLTHGYALILLLFINFEIVVFEKIYPLIIESVFTIKLGFRSYVRTKYFPLTYSICS
ncbi:hypothetical protein ZH92_004471 [Salmonella enterica subsp. enterica]|nr:hypothetical protein [Salmonella enterica]EBI6016054.1 hypothetical protein [Salmonella enterica]EDQ2666575.1 hypothetical protein [Salmonella enterica subsp. enterica]HAF5770886.1 hypothetical protein [Salmonella enterica]HAF6294991.1 hypothetical protein [Salmonella enterica]